MMESEQLTTSLGNWAQNTACTNPSYPNETRLSPGMLDELCLSWYQLRQEQGDANSWKILCNEEWLTAMRSKQLYSRDANLFRNNLPCPIECKLMLEPSYTDSCAHHGLHVLRMISLQRQGQMKRAGLKKNTCSGPENGLGQLMCYVDSKLCKMEKSARRLNTQDNSRQALAPNTFSEDVLEELVGLFSSGEHEGSLKLLGNLTTPSTFYLFFRHEHFRLKNVICFTPQLMSGANRPLFIIYQILQYLRWLHSYGLSHDNLTANSLFVDENLWVRVDHPRLGLQYLTRDSESKAAQVVESGTYSLLSAARAWMRGYISNLDYLLLLNKFSGRVSGDPNLHPIVPWVIDFSVSHGGWRDLNKSKFRLNKGDFHLDSTYKIHGLRGSAPSTTRSRRSFHEEEREVPVTPHHLIDTLSEITFFSYFARRMPRSLLCRYVRSKWEPHEYPSSVSAMYQWTPDECVPEFYTDPTLFTSIHTDLPDLTLPPWAKDSSEFIAKHRNALEGDHVSSRLHSWIDITFGDKLFGPAAVQSKNVYKELVDNHKTITNRGVRQLFQYPHPKRLCSVPPIPQLPQSNTDTLMGGDTCEVCEEPEYDEYQDVNIRRSTINQTDGRVDGEVTVQSLQRNNSIDPSVFRNFIQRRAIRNAETESLDSIRESPSLPSLEMASDEEELDMPTTVKNMNQFFASIGGTLCGDMTTTTDTSTMGLSLNERQRRDIQAVGCILIEMLTPSHIPEYGYMSWDRYLAECQQLWNRNRNDIFLFLNDLIEYLLRADDVFCTPEYMLHPDNTTLSVPPFFHPLYNLFHNMEKRCDLESKILYCSTFITTNPKFLPSLEVPGMLLLLGYLKPLFYGPGSCKTFIKLFDVLATHCNHKALSVLGSALEEFYRNTDSSSDRIMLSNVNFVMSVKRHFGLKEFLSRFVSFIIEDIVHTESYAVLEPVTQTLTQYVQPSALAMECYSSLKQTLPSLGPILTAKYVTSRLLQVLVGCYVYNDVSGARCGGEELVAKFLIDIALIYGEAFIDTQYIPRVFNMVKSAMFRVTNKNEGKLLAALHVVRDSVKCIDGPTLHNMLNDLQMFMFEPIMRLLTSTRILFPHSGSGRLLLCKSLSTLLVQIVKHVQCSFVQDPETGKSLVLPLVKQYFQMFDSVSYLYVEDTGKEQGEPHPGGEGARDVSTLQGGAPDGVMSPSSQYSLLDRSQDADYFKHLKEQFPSYPRRYYSSSDMPDSVEPPPQELDITEGGSDPVPSSPTSRELELSEALQLESEDIVDNSAVAETNAGAECTCSNPLFSISS